MSEHQESAPPSDPPEALEESRDRVASYPNGRAVSGAWIGAPAEEDDGAGAVAYRARRAHKIARQLRETIGRVPSTRSDGVKDEGAGMLKWQHSIETKVDAVLALLQEGQTKRKGIAGWLAARGDRLADVLLPLIVLALAAAFSGHVSLK